MIELAAIGRRNPVSTSDSWLVRAIDLRINAGDRIGMTGPSGAGKTVLLRLIAALDRPDEGELLWNGRAISDEQIPTYRSQVIYLNQRSFFAEGTVLDNLKLPFQFAVHDTRRFDYDRVLQNLRDAGRAEDFLHLDAQNLSGGEAQLVAVIRAIQLDPTVLLLDEPSASADEEMELHIERMIRAWQNVKASRAYVLVSHTAKQIRRMATRTIQLEAGSVPVHRVAP